MSTGIETELLNLLSVFILAAGLGASILGVQFGIDTAEFDEDVA